MIRNDAPLSPVDECSMTLEEISREEKVRWANIRRELDGGPIGVVKPLAEDEGTAETTVSNQNAIIS